MDNTRPVTDDTDNPEGKVSGALDTNDLVIPRIVLLGLSPMVAQVDIFDLFWQCKGFFVADVRFLGNRKDYRYRAGYVIFEDVGSARRAMEQHRNAYLGGKLLCMHLAKRSAEDSKQTK